MEPQDSKKSSLVDIFCPLGKRKCRHCSEMIIPRVSRGCLIMTRKIKGKIVKAGDIIRIETSTNFGTFCNAVSKYTGKLERCPLELLCEVTGKVEKIPAKSGKKLKEPVNELEWMKRRL